MALHYRMKLAPSRLLESILDKALNEVLESNCNETCKLVVTVLKEDFDLSKHLDALQNVMINQTAGILFNFYFQLFTEVFSTLR